LNPADIDAAEPALRDADCVVLQLEIPLPTVYHTLRMARRLGVRSILNPAPGQPLDFRELANADYVIPNETEAEALSGLPAGSLDEARACARCLRDRGARGVIVTLGANGALFDDRHVEPHRVSPLDTTGAGDAFIGAFATFLAGGDGEQEAIRKANVYAALSTLGVGTQSSFVTRQKFEEVWKS
jgi:ribokinase